MNERQFLSGLSGGVSFFAIAGAFWLGLGISQLPTMKVGWPVFALATLLQAGGCVGLLWGAVRLRRKSRLRISELMQVEGRRRAEARHILVVFTWTAVIQAVLIGVAVWWCVRTRLEPMIWPLIGLVVSLHLVPLARIFHVRAYYIAAAAGAIISLAGLTIVQDPHRLIFLCIGMTAVMWASARYLPGISIRLSC